MARSIEDDPSYGGAANVPVDSYIQHRLAMARRARSRDADVYCGESYDGQPRAYERRVKADKRAIANLDSLPRPKRPPGR